MHVFTVPDPVQKNLFNGIGSMQMVPGSFHRKSLSMTHFQNEKIQNAAKFNMDYKMLLNYIYTGRDIKTHQRTCIFFETQKGRASPYEKLCKNYELNKTTSLTNYLKLVSKFY